MNYKALFFLFGFTAMLPSGQAAAQHALEDPAMLSVRIFHSTCMKALIDKEATYEILDKKFPRVDAGKSLMFTRMLKLPEDSEGWTLNFEENNLVIMVDSKSKTCNLVGSAALNYETVKQEFQNTATNMSEESDFSYDGFRTEDLEKVQTVRLTYNFKESGIKMPILASLYDPSSSSIGSIFTMKLFNPNAPVPQQEELPAESPAAP